MQLNSAFSIGQQVYIDSHDMVGTVVAIMWDGSIVEYKIGWINNGISYHDWFPAFRLGGIDKYKT